MIQRIDSFRKFAEERYDRLGDAATSALSDLIRKIEKIADQIKSGLSKFLNRSNKQGNLAQRSRGADVELKEVDGNVEGLVQETQEEETVCLNSKDLEFFILNSTQEALQVKEKIEALVEQKGVISISEDIEVLELGEEVFEIDEISFDDMDVSQQSISDEDFALLEGLNGNDLVDLRVFIGKAALVHTEDKEIARIYEKVKEVEARQIEIGIELASKL